MRFNMQPREDLTGGLLQAVESACAKAARKIPACLKNGRKTSVAEAQTLGEGARSSVERRSEGAAGVESRLSRPWQGHRVLFLREHFHSFISSEDPSAKASGPGLSTELFCFGIWSPPIRSCLV